MAMTDAERARKYREKLKQNPKKYEVQRQKKLKRMRMKRTRIDDLSDKQKTLLRLQWRLQKRKQTQRNVIKTIKIEEQKTNEIFSQTSKSKSKNKNKQIQKNILNKPSGVLKEDLNKNTHSSKANGTHRHISNKNNGKQCVNNKKIKINEVDIIIKSDSKKNNYDNKKEQGHMKAIENKVHKKVLKKVKNEKHQIKKEQALKTTKSNEKFLEVSKLVQKGMSPEDKLNALRQRYRIKSVNYNKALKIIENLKSKIVIYKRRSCKRELIHEKKVEELKISIMKLKARQEILELSLCQSSRLSELQNNTNQSDIGTCNDFTDNFKRHGIVRTYSGRKCSSKNNTISLVNIDNSVSVIKKIFWCDVSESNIMDVPPLDYSIDRIAPSEKCENNLFV